MNFELAKTKKGEIITKCNHCDQESIDDHLETCFACDFGKFQAVFKEELNED
jgi:ribosomal protein L37E